MDVIKKSREFLIKSILDKELRMFLAVESEGAASCQEHPEVFKQIRGSIYEMWSHEMLESYFKDLVLAERGGRNLVFEKYARMDNRIPQLSDNPLIGKIADIEEKWQQEIKSKYPAIYQHTCRDMSLAGDGSDFRVYLSCELETYGDKTLENYFKHIQAIFEADENWSLDMLEKLAQKSGIENLDILEERILADQNQ